MPSSWTPSVPTYLGPNGQMERDARKNLIRLLGNLTEHTMNANLPIIDDDRRAPSSALPSVIVRLLALYAWRNGLEFLTQEIEFFWEQAIVGPSVEDFGRLKAARKYAERLYHDLNIWLDQMLPLLKLGITRSDDRYINELKGLPMQVSNLKQEISDTFQLLIGAIAIRDSEVQKKLARESRQQARRATALTALAAVYLPLSLTTGVFGMNITEINQGTPKYWAVLALGSGLLVATLPFLLWVFLDKDDDDQDKKQRPVPSQRRDDQGDVHHVKDEGSGILRRRTTASSRMSRVAQGGVRTDFSDRTTRPGDMV